MGRSVDPVEVVQLVRKSLATSGVKMKDSIFEKVLVKLGIKKPKEFYQTKESMEKLNTPLLKNYDRAFPSDEELEQFNGKQ